MNTLARRTDDVEVKIVVVVPHQGNLNIRGFGALTLETGLKFGHGTLRCLSGFQQLGLPCGFNLSDTLRLCSGQVRLALKLTLLCEPGLLGLALLLSEFGFHLLLLKGCLGLGASSSFFFSAPLTLCILFFQLGFATLVEPSFGQLPVALAGIAEHVLNQRKFPVEVFLGFTEPHAGMLAHQPFSSHAALDVDGRLPANQDEQETHHKGPAQGKGQNIVGWVHRFAHDEQPLQTYDRFHRPP